MRYPSIINQKVLKQLIEKGDNKKIQRALKELLNKSPRQVILILLMRYFVLFGLRCGDMFNRVYFNLLLLLLFLCN